MIEINERTITRDGNSWESTINSCYRLRYQSDGYQEIPAEYKGDGGIEGFTKSGVVYQCYCPEKEYSTDDLYTHLRDKLTRDIEKFITPRYSDLLKKLGIRIVKEWHFVIPTYKDRRILEHVAVKEELVRKYALEHPEQCGYIDKDFVITIKVLEDFRPEILRLQRGEIGTVDLRISHQSEIDWDKCESEKVDNIKRKIRAVMDVSEENLADYEAMVETFMNSYVEGIGWFDQLRREDTEYYEQILSLQEAYKKKVSIQTKMNPDSTMNYSIFLEIMNDFEATLKKEMPFLNVETITELKMVMISDWLADCSMQFRKKNSESK